MSGFAAIYNLDGQPVVPEQLTRFRDAAASRGPDASNHWICGQVGLAHCLLRTTPESVAETQPWSDESGQIVLIADARVDNREELGAAITAGGLNLRNTSDAELLLRAYQRWGEEFPLHVLGDFALAIWDARLRRMFCARDIIGLKPLLYFSDGRVFLCASAVRQFFQHPAFHPVPNETMIAGLLGGCVGNFDQTLYRGLLRLPPAHSLSVSPQGLRLVRYWDVDPERRTRYRDDREYAEHFREVFREAVRCRLRSNGPSGVLLSGGVDSSSIACMARSIEQAGDGGTVECFSLTFPGHNCDESRYIQAVAERFPGVHWQVPVRFDELDFAADAHLRRLARSRDIPEPPTGPMFDPLHELARSRGIRTMLDGMGGDEWLSGNQLHHADLLTHFRIGSLVRQMLAERGMPRPAPWSKLLRSCLAPLLPAPLLRWRRRAFGEQQPPWLGPTLAPLAAQQARHYLPPAPRFATWAQTGIYQTALSHGEQLGTEMHERDQAEFQSEARSPYSDRRVIEFAIGLPEEQRWRANQTKFVLRQAMQGLLPDLVRTRRDKAEFSGAFLRFYDVIGGKAFFSSLHIARLGWVRTEGLQRLLERMGQLPGERDRPSPIAITLWNVAAMEFWYRQLTDGPTRLAKPLDCA